MNDSLLHSLVLVSAPAAGLLVNSVWTGLVLVIGVSVLLRCVPELGAIARSALWTAVLLVILLLPFASFHSLFADGRERGVVHATVTWSLLISAVWVVLSALRLAQLGAGALRLRTMAGRAVPLDHGEGVTALLARSRRRVGLWVSADVNRPSVVGFLRPRILVPIGLIEELSESELEHVVLHELEHLRRLDDWTNLLQKLSLALFPLHPALFWLDRRLCLEREFACDDGVLRATHARKAYAACLARLAEGSMVRRGMSLVLGLLGSRERRSELSGRLERILRSPASALSRVQVGVATTILLAGVLGGSVLLAHSPRLISFSAETKQVETAQVPAAHVGLPVLAHKQTSRATLVKAVMPSSAPKVMRVTTPADRRPSAVRRVVLDRGQRITPTAPYVMLTEWHDAAAGQSQMTLTVARYSQAGQASQSTYAAVPVQGGWLLIQL